MKIKYTKKKKKVNTECLRENHKEFIKNNKSILKTQIFKSERHNFFTEEINKIALSSNDDEIIQSIDLIEIYKYRACKDLICKKEKTKYSNIIKQYKKCLTLIQISHKDLVIHPEY